MFTSEDIGVKLPTVVCYDLDGTAMPHGAIEPDEETVTVISTLRSKGVEDVIVTGRDIEDCRPALTKFGGRLAVIDGGATTVYIDRIRYPHDKPLIRPAVWTGLGFGLQIINEYQAEMIVDYLDDHLKDEAAATIRIPGWARKQRVFNAFRDGQEPDPNDEFFTDITSIFVSNLSSSEAAQQLAQQVNDLIAEDLRDKLIAIPVTSQADTPEVQITRSHSKYHAIRELAIHGLDLFLHTPHPVRGEDTLENSIYIGNSVNDLPGFEAVGLGVAMADSPPEILRRAGYIIDPQGSGGFVDFMRLLSQGQGGYAYGPSPWLRA